MKDIPQVFLVVLTFVFKAEGEAPQRGYCTGKNCYAVFREQADFITAQRHCNMKDGHLMTVQSVDANMVLSLLVGSYSGNYWIGLQLATNECAKGGSALRGYRWIDSSVSKFYNWDENYFHSSCDAYRCVSVSQKDAYKWRQNSCDKQIAGFLCEYTFKDTCSPFVKGDEYVQYTTPIGLEGTDLLSFPHGSIAIRKPGKIKHICDLGVWKRAPWSCEIENGGCEYDCVYSNQKPVCTCSPGKSPHEDDNICVKDTDLCLDLECTHHCVIENHQYACRCRQDFILGVDNKTCENLPYACRDNSDCPGENFECGESVNYGEGLDCKCKNDYDLVDGVCKDVQICQSCEQRCKLSGGTYKCTCMDGYIESKINPNKCELYCPHSECLAKCDPNNQDHCDCPKGHIHNERNGTQYCTDYDECENGNECDHECTNTFGSFKCSCREGYELVKDRDCVELFDGSGSSSPPYEFSTPFARHVYPTKLPSNIKTGRIYIILVGIIICILLMSFMVYHHSQKRCGTFDLKALKEQSVDIGLHHLQQVTTEKYKKLSFDRQLKNDTQ